MNAAPIGSAKEEGAMIRIRQIHLGVAGLVLVGVGCLLVTDRFTALNSQFQFLDRWITAAEKALQ